VNKRFYDIKDVMFVDLKCEKKMNEFILIVVWLSFYNNAAAITTQEFIGKEHCYNIAQKLKKENNIVDAYCVPKRGKN
jgi:hypothetical protein